MKSIQELVQPHLLNLKPYSSARHEFLGEADIFLDANENPNETGYNRYPDPLQTEVKRCISHWRSVRTDQVFLGNGSDEAIDLMIRIFCRPGLDKIITTDPTYGMYKVSAQTANVGIIRVPLTNTFQLSVKEIQAQFSDETKILFLCNPNNPTANLLDPAAMKTLIESFPGIVVIDEAYIDFSLNDSWLPKLDHYDNLVILQTFSKAWGLAGIRLGMAFASPEIISWFNKVKPPYNVNILTQRVALKAFENIGQQTTWVAEILSERDRLAIALNGIECIDTVYPSATNFILVKMDDATRRYEQLTSQKIVVRNRSNVLLCEECLRFTVGTPKENDKLINALQS